MHLMKIILSWELQKIYNSKIIRCLLFNCRQSTTEICFDLFYINHNTDHQLTVLSLSPAGRQKLVAGLLQNREVVWLAGQPTHQSTVRTVFSDRTLFFYHNNQPEQYFGLFFSPAEQAPKPQKNLLL